MAQCGRKCRAKALETKASAINCEEKFLSKEERKISRRTYLKYVGAVGVAAALVGVGAGWLAKPTPAPPSAVTATATTTATATATATATSAEAPVLEIYHWWTSGGEAAAINALVKVFNEKYPDIAVLQSPIAGGAGFVMKAAMKSLVLAGEAPDSFQLHAGYEGKPYFDAGYLDPIDDLWTSQGLASVMPSVVQDMVKFSGDYYAVPVDIHRPNVVWYNKTILDASGIDPTSLTTWSAFFAACDKLVTAGIKNPICIGDTDKWEDTHVLEQTIAGEGIDFYQDWINGKVTSATDPKLLDALQTYKKYLGYINSDHGTLTWDEATAMVIKGTAAFNVMGDWANGEFLVARKTYGKDYGSFPVPGTAGMYGLVIDCFEHPKGVKHPQNSLKWLGVVGSKEGQDAFNPLKGSISPRSDSDESKYGPYQVGAIADFHSAKYMYPSVTHGSGAPESYLTPLNNITSAFVANLDVNAAATAMANAATASAADYTTVWKLY
jgi:glucose/mannose transport system substrate-binding protein